MFRLVSEIIEVYDSCRDLKDGRTGTLRATILGSVGWGAKGTKDLGQQHYKGNEILKQTKQAKTSFLRRNLCPVPDFEKFFLMMSHLGGCKDYKK